MTPQTAPICCTELMVERRATTTQDGTVLVQFLCAKSSRTGVQSVCRAPRPREDTSSLASMRHAIQEVCRC